MPDKTQAEIPYSHVEYTGVFGKPILGALSPPANLISAILNALEPWGFRPEGVELKTHVEKLNEYKIIFRRTVPLFPGQNLTLEVGRVVIAAENLDWSEVDKFIAQWSGALDAIRQIGRAEIQSQHLLVGLHLQVKDRPRRDITIPLFQPAVFELLDGEITLPGLILLREKSSIVIDGSVAYANGLFVRISREHPPDATPEHLAGTLRRDEEKLFAVLGLEGIP